jgi:dTDP-4-dehydrorhamnose 3,5-epimerase
MNIIETELPDVKIIEPKMFGDTRGFFLESWNALAFANMGLDIAFVQDNHSRSDRGVLRGLHYQLIQPQGKLVRVVSGAVFDVAVDMRRASPCFGKSVGVKLSAQNKRMLWIPPGFAHGFFCLEDGTDFLYKCTDFYAPEHEKSMLWNDPVLNIQWPLNDILPQLSAKDRDGLPLANCETYS